MKLDKNLLKECYRSAMILQYKNTLEKQGFVASTEYPVFGIKADLYAEKDSEKRVYEFKLTGNKKYVKGNLSKFKDLVESHNAIPYVVYVNPPAEKQIDFDHLNEILTNHFIGGEVPQELEVLSTHTSVNEVEIDDLTSVEIANGVITIEGYAIISVELQYGSGSDVRNDMGLRSNDSFPMSFSVRLKYEEDYSIVDIDYGIDTSSFYE